MGTKKIIRRKKVMSKALTAVIFWAAEDDTEKNVYLKLSDVEVYLEHYYNWEAFDTAGVSHLGPRISGWQGHGNIVLDWQGDWPAGPGVLRVPGWTDSSVYVNMRHLGYDPVRVHFQGVGRTPKTEVKNV
jgi:hypothetical protein